MTSGSSVSALFARTTQVRATQLSGSRAAATKPSSSIPRKPLACPSEASESREATPKKLAHSRKRKPPRRLRQTAGDDSKSPNNAQQPGTGAQALPALLGATQDQETTSQTETRRDFAWALQKKAKEIFASTERDLSARGVAHREDEHFRREITRISNALAAGTAKMAKAEAFKCHFNRAYAYGRLGYDQKALDDYTEALAVMPTNGVAYFNRSQVLTKLARYEDAIQDLTTALRFDPAGSIDYLHNRALLHRQLGRFSQAMADYESSETYKRKTQGLARGAGAVRREAIATAADFAKLSLLNGGSGLGSLAALLKTPLHQRTLKDIHEIADMLSDVLAFKSVPHELLRQLSGLAKLVSLPANAYVFEEGDVGSDLYVILSGSVTVRKRPSQQKAASFTDELNELMFGDTVWRDDVILARLHAGVSFGELGDDEVAQSCRMDPISNELGAAGDKPRVVEETSEESINRLFSGSKGPAGQISSRGEAHEQKEGNEQQDEDDNEDDNDQAEEVEGADPAVPGPGSTDSNPLGSPPMRSRQKTIRETRRRKASIRVEEDVDLLVFETSASANKVLNKYREWQISDRMAVLRKCTVFASWSDEGLRKLAKLAMVQQYAPGSVLVEQGSAVTDVFVLRTGVCTIYKRVEVSTPVLPKDLGHPIRSRSYESICDDARKMADYSASKLLGTWRTFELGTLTGSQISGEFAILENAQRFHSPVSIVARTTTDSLVISKEDIAEVLPLFYGESMARVRASLKANSMAIDQINSMYTELRGWGREKTRIINSTVRMNNRLRRAQLQATKSEAVL